jgi:hypothetical protein
MDADEEAVDDEYHSAEIKQAKYEKVDTMEVAKQQKTSQ